MRILPSLTTRALTALLLGGLIGAGASTSACSLLGEEDPPAGVAFQYEASGCSAYTCTPHNREILAGSTVTLLANSDQPHREGRLVTDAFATIVSQRETCSCTTTDGRGDTRLQDPDGPCPAKHAKVCSLAIDLATKASGDAVLEIVEHGAPLTETTVKVRNATRVDVVVGYGFSIIAPTEGAYDVKVGQPVQLSPRFFGEEQAMLATKESVRFAYDAALLSPTEVSLTTASTILQVVPRAAGKAGVSIAAGALVSEVELRAVP